MFSRRGFLSLLAGTPLAQWFPLPAELHPYRSGSNLAASLEEINALTLTITMPGVRAAFLREPPLFTYFGYRAPKGPQQLELPFGQD